MTPIPILSENGSIVDRRFIDLPGTNTVFDPPMPTYDSREAWEQRRAELRLHILVSAGLFPTPERCPLNPRVTGRVDGDGFIVENVYFESLPGFYVTGNLYRPSEGNGPFPGIACPHGHARHGRFEDTEEFSVPSRAITLARQGNIAFSYDMVGYNDSLQIPHDFQGKREYLWGLSLLGLQLWNSIRVLDFLESLDEVDSTRLACTGASGGGTQTFLLTAVDDRVKVAVPVNMVSAHMQGGCLCENAPHLRLDTTNVEIAAMAAPRPMLLISATGDWTKNTPTVEFPAIRSIYRLYDAEDRLAHVQIDAGHNYNKPSREAMYAWMGRWLHGEPDVSKFREPPYTLPPVDRLRVFPNDALPPEARRREEIVETFIEMAVSQIEALVPVEPTSIDRTTTVLGAMFHETFNVEMPQSTEVRRRVVAEGIESLILSRPGAEETVPARMLSADGNVVGIAVVVSASGKDALLEDERTAALRGSGFDILLIDPFQTGETSDVVRNEEERHFFTFNRTALAWRVQDILTAVAYAQQRTPVVHLIGVEEAGWWALFARAFAPNVRVTIADMAGLPVDDATFEERFYLPGIRRAGDVTTAGILAAPGTLRLYNVHSTFDPTPIEGVYHALGHARRFSASPSALDTSALVAYCRSADSPSE